MADLLAIQGLRKLYPRKGSPLVAVDNLTLSLQPGEVLGFLGPNGAGKTTVVKCVCGLIWPEGGQIRVGGINPATHRSQALRQVGAVLEGARNVYWQLTPRENLDYFGRLRRVPAGTRRTRVPALLAQLGLEANADKPVKELSRGNQQRVAIAVALLHDPPLLLLDEPTLGLDLPATEVMVAEVRRLAQEQGKSILLTTHQLEVAERVCDRIAVMKEGRLLLCETRTALMERFDARRATQVTVAGSLEPAERTWLSDRYPGLSFAETPEGTRVAFLANGSAAAEQIFVDLWQRGHTVLTFNRKASLQEVYAQLIGGEGPEGGGGGAPAVDDRR